MGRHTAMVRSMQREERRRDQAGQLVSPDDALPQTIRPGSAAVAVMTLPSGPAAGDGIWLERRGVGVSVRRDAGLVREAVVGVLVQEE